MKGTPLLRQFLSEKMLAVLDDEMVDIRLEDSTDESIVDDLSLLNAIVEYATGGDCELAMSANDGQVYIFTRKAYVTV